ncbi:MAG: NAD(P)H-hydrate dehydratase [Bacteroidota bacterium]|nr:NAD(P)H-hydrate dehydratase [Bacteroidota bacterium]
MEILSAPQIRAWDQYTMEHEPVASIDLMERAAAACFSWLKRNGYAERSFSVFCGKGNNGGDGLALARMLSRINCPVSVSILEFGHKGTDDFQVNLARLHEVDVEVRFIQGEEHFRPLPSEDVVIDALLGSGLNRALDGVTEKLVGHLNRSGNEIIAIDIPSGLFVDRSSKGNACISATHTLSFQCLKPAFLVAENADCIGKVHVLDIGLQNSWLMESRSELELVDRPMIAAIFKPRNDFAHKGHFGHALMIAGSQGKMGAASLSALACLRAGVGLLTCHVPGCGYGIIQTSVPEAMVQTDKEDKMSTALPNDFAPGKFAVIGIGPGIGQDQRTKSMMQDVLRKFRRPMVIDADALNILAIDKFLLSEIPPYSILTPHPKEFERLFGGAGDDFARIQSAREAARQFHCVVVLKGHYTFIAMPGGKGYFNSTGNSGMAKGGSGDVLTGILTALIAQGYSPGEAALLGVYIHGLAGDLAAAANSRESMLPSDLIGQLGKAFISLYKPQ